MTAYDSLNWMMGRAAARTCDAEARAMAARAANVIPSANTPGQEPTAVYKLCNTSRGIANAWFSSR